MTAAELIAKLQAYPPEAEVMSFHEDIRTIITHQLQQVHTTDYMNAGGFKWVVIQAKGIDYKTLQPHNFISPNTPSPD